VVVDSVGIVESGSVEVDVFKVGVVKPVAVPVVDGSTADVVEP